MRIEFDGTDWVPSPVSTFGLSFGKFWSIFGVVMFIVITRMFSFGI